MRQNAATAYAIYNAGDGFLFQMIFTVYSIFVVLTLGFIPAQLVLLGTILEGAETPWGCARGPHRVGGRVAPGRALMVARLVGPPALRVGPVQGRAGWPDRERRNPER